MIDFLLFSIVLVMAASSVFWFIIGSVLIGKGIARMLKKYEPKEPEKI